MSCILFFYDKTDIEQDMREELYDSARLKGAQIIYSR